MPTTPQSKGGILSKACDYIRELRQTNQRMQETFKEAERLQMDNELLRQQVSHRAGSEVRGSPWVLLATPAPRLEGNPRSLSSPASSPRLCALGHRLPYTLPWPEGLN